MQCATLERVFAYVVFSIAILAAVSGCAGVDMTAKEKARTAGYELSNVYVPLHEEYERLYPELPPHRQEWLSDQVAPKMNALRRLLITYNSAVIYWSSEEGDGQKAVAERSLRGEDHESLVGELDTWPEEAGAPPSVVMMETRIRTLVSDVVESFSYAKQNFLQGEGE